MSSVPFHSFVWNNGFRYFNLTIDDEDVDATVRVTIFSGDVDIYIKVDDLPTDEDNDIASFF
jgi:hypothetical protein